MCRRPPPPTTTPRFASTAPAVPFAVLAQRAAWEADVRAHDFVPLAQTEGLVAAVAAVPVQSDAEAGVIAAHRQLARWARNAQAAPGPAGRHRRQGGKPAPA